MRLSDAIRRGHAPWIDVGIALLFVGMTIVEARAADWDGAAWRIASTALLAWRRSFPTTVALVVITVALLSDENGQTAATLAMALAAFTVGNELPPPRATRSLALMVGVTAVAGGLAGAITLPSDVAALFVFIAAPTLIGMSQHQRMRAEATATARAARAEELALIEAERGAIRERARIARELHDIVAHSLTVVTINAQAVRRALGPSQGREAEALATIEATTRDASAEMRRLLGVLRRDSADESLQPQPGLAQLPALVDRCAAAGLEVRVESDPASTLPGGLDVTAYRIVQEALTNVLRHAEASSAVVRVRHRCGVLDLEIEDNGRGGPVNGAGHGLAGIRERAVVYGGRADFAGSDTGFRVRVTLPVGGPP